MTQPNCLMLIVLVALAALALLPSPSIITTSIVTTAQAKEIVATNEWQLLGENDTLPAGLHVRIDLTTGEKWAKNSDVDETADESNDNADISVDGSGSSGSGSGGGAEGVRKKEKSIWNKVKSFFKRGSNKTNSTSEVEMETATIGDGEVVTTLSSTTTATTTTTYSTATNAVTNNDKLGVTDDIIIAAAREKREALAARDRHVQSLHATTTATNGDNGGGDSSSSSSSAGAVSVIIDNDGSVLSSSSSSSSSKSSNNNNNDDESSSSTTTSTTSNNNKKDYEMMHRVMSKLPPEELDRFGGLPQLTLLPSTTNTTNGTSRSDELVNNLTLAQREYFERRMEELWSARQEELRMAQDGLADLPGMLKQRIGILVSYLNDTNASLQGMLFQRRNNTLQEEVNDDIKKMKQENDTNSVEEQGIVTNVIDALKDLEYLLSDVDMARDFHTLGGWGPLVTLLDVNVHTVVVDMHPVEKEEVDNDTEVETTTTMMILIDEIRTLAAMTIGTAVGNMGEFRFWALEDVNMSVSSSSSTTSTSTTTTNAVSLLTTSLQDVLSFQNDDTSPSSLGAQYVARAKYNLRAIYALGALLRGNPIAQQYFVTYNGPELLVLNALYTISSSNSDNDDGRRRQRMVSLDYKFASRVLALGEDVVMDIILHNDEYSERNNQQQWEEEMTASRLVAAFTSESWCTLSLRLLSSLPEEEDITVLQKRSIRTGAMTAVRALAPACRERTNNDKWGLEEVQLVRSEWNREGSDDGLDPVYRRELLVLTDEILEELRA